MKIPLLKLLPARLDRGGKVSCRTVTLAFAVAAFGTQSVHAAAYTFTNGSGDSNYSNAANWSGGVVPNTANGDTATIANGSAVTYPGASSGDLVVRNGAVLEISNGSFTQSTGTNYLQLGSASGTGGTILVNGGTFNQGSITSNPFNVNGTGNLFNVTAGGTAILNHGFSVSTGLSCTVNNGNLNVSGGNTTVSDTLAISGSSTAVLGTTTVNASGNFAVSGTSVVGLGQGAVNGSMTISGSAALTLSGQLAINSGGTLSMTGGTVKLNSGNLIGAGSFTMSGGTITLATGETDFNNNQNFLNGGTINTPLITGANGPAGAHIFSISAGTLNITGSNYNGIYGGSMTQYINFTPNSSGQITFTSGQETVAQVKGFLTSGVIEFNNTVETASTPDFSITQRGNDVILTLANVTPVPEASTVASSILLSAFAFWKIILRRRRASVA